MGNPRHRPERSYPDARRVIVECELETCIHCGEQLVPSGTWHTRKTLLFNDNYNYPLTTTRNAH